MASVKISVMIEVDGEPLRGFPLTRRFEPVDRDSFDATIASNVAFIALPASGQVGSIQALLFQAQGQTMSIRLNGTVGSEVPLNKGGFVLVMDSTGFTGPTIQNNSGLSGKAIGLTLGT